MFKWPPTLNLNRKFLNSLVHFSADRFFDEQGLVLIYFVLLLYDSISFSFLIFLQRRNLIYVMNVIHVVEILETSHIFFRAINKRKKIDTCKTINSK